MEIICVRVFSFLSQTRKKLASLNIPVESYGSFLTTNADNNFRSSVVDGGYTEWSLWSTCTKSCDGGTQIRTRNCTLPLPIDGGLDCADLGIGGDEESRKCNTLVCPGEKGMVH